MRRAEPEGAAEGGGHPHRAAGVGAKCEVGEAGGHHRRRSAGRPARQQGRIARIGWRAKVPVLAFQAEGQFICYGLPAERRAAFQQALDGRRMAERRGLIRSPIRIATAGNGAGDVDEILHCKAQAVQRAVS
jgi:hypothetical protein